MALAIDCQEGGLISDRSRHSSRNANNWSDHRLNWVILSEWLIRLKRSGEIYSSSCNVDHWSWILSNRTGRYLLTNWTSSVWTILPLCKARRNHEDCDEMERSKDH